MRKTLLLLAIVLACRSAPANAQYGGGEMYDEPRIYTGLWWNPGESGWGLNTTHQGSIVFATLFTYAADGQPLWLVAPDLAESIGGGYGYGMEYGMDTYTYSGPLYRTFGPAFNAAPWTPIGFAQVGTMSIEFDSAATGMLTYTFEGATVVKSVQRQVFASAGSKLFLAASYRPADAARFYVHSRRSGSAA